MRSLACSLLLSSLLAVMVGGCGDDDGPGSGETAGGTAGVAGASGGGTAGASGKGGAGKGGASGSSGQPGAGQGGAGQGGAGQAGQGGAGSGGSPAAGGAGASGGGGTTAGAAGTSAGSAGAAGEAGQAGQAGQGGGAGESGAAGEAGQAGAGQAGEAGQGGEGGQGGEAGQGGAGQAGEAGQGGAAGQGAGGAAGLGGAGAGGAGAAGSGQGGSDPGPGVRLRVVAANLTSGNYQTYDPGHGRRILAGVHPDVVLVQEFNYLSNKPADFNAMTGEVLGDSGYYMREASATAQIPNGVISRYPIVASGYWEDTLSSNREFAWARIDVPGTRDLWAVSVHLLTANATTRNKEAQALVALIKQNVPADDLLVLGGDFNTDVREEPCAATFGAEVLVVGPTFPVDNKGLDTTSVNRKKPYDWVLANKDLEALSIGVQLGASFFPTGLVVDTRVYAPLSEIAPAQVGDSGSTNMQHMAVVRDFWLPTP